MNMFNLIPTTAELELSGCDGTCDGCDGCLGCDGQKDPGSIGNDQKPPK